MGTFSNAVGKLQGDPAAVFSLSRSWKEYAERVAEIRVSCLNAGSLAPSGQGSRVTVSNGAFRPSQTISLRSATGRTKPPMPCRSTGGLSTATRSPWRTSRRAMMRSTPSTKVWIRLRSWFSYPFFQMEADRNKASFDLYVEQAKGAATECAARLREALHIEAGVPDGNGIGRRSGLSPEQIEAINAQIASGNMSYEDIQQHGIGDCYYLAAIMALTKSPEGRQTIQDSIKVHYGPDGKPDGFMVTVYDDPLHPDAKASRTVFVDDVYANGVTGPDGKPNYASILESAYGQQHPGGALDSGKDNGISGGSRNQRLRI